MSKIASSVTSLIIDGSVRNLISRTFRQPPQIGVYHHIDQLFEANCRLPSQYLTCPGTIPAEVWVKGPACNESSPFQAQLILMAGTGSVRR